MPSVSDPDWKRDEIVLALDLYMEQRKTPDKRDPRVLELSDILRRLPIHPQAARTEKFRSPNSIAMKCGNLQFLDPDVPGGLPSISNLDRKIWEEFWGRRDQLHALALRLKAAAQADEATITGMKQSVGPEEVASMEASEGETLYRLHRYKERNKKIAQRKKDTVMEQQGKLICEVCDFDFAVVYGPLGQGYIECHHTKPLSLLSAGDKTLLKDLALVCANCHRMLHRMKIMSIDALRSLRSHSA